MKDDYSDHTILIIIIFKITLLSFLFLFGHLTFTIQMVSLNAVFHIHVKDMEVELSFFNTYCLIVDILIGICFFSKKNFLAFLLAFPLESKIISINNSVLLFLQTFFRFVLNFFPRKYGHLFYFILFF